MVAILLATCLMVVIQSSGYSIFHDGDTPIWLGLSYKSHTPVSISTLKPPLGAIGAIPLKPQVSPMVDTGI